MSKSIARVYRSRISKFFLLLGPIVIAVGLLLFQISVVQSAAGLTVEILAGYNLVVDSNVASRSTDSPSVATIAARFCNPATNTDTLHDVIGYIGDYTSDLATSTPGVYPIRTSGDPGFDTTHPRLAGTGPYSFTHLGEVSDASRFIGDLAPGQCSVQYWSFSYPRCENNEAPPCSGDTVYGVSNNLADDLYLYFDVWGQGIDPSDQTTKTADATHRLTMRSEISASANQIWPNGGSWFNTNASTVLPGDVITSNGVNYTFGNVSGGFDNDNDGLPDNNAWVQPFGDPTYDPNCFRLIRTTVILTQTLTGNQQRVDTYIDQLYFKLASNNTNVIGEVHYTFLALGGACTADMSPYQEAASGSNNEKFNSDYGTAVPPLVSNPPQATVDKTATASVSEGEMITYAIPFANTGSTPIGLIQFGEPPVNINLPFVVEDTVPDGLSYVCGSPSATLDFAGGYTLLFSKDSGMTWSSSETGLWPECAVQGTPTTQVSAGPNNSILIQWRLNEPLPPGGSGTATFQAYVPVGYIQAGGSPVIQNTACIKLDNVEKIFGCASDTTTVGGPNSLNGTVFFDQVNQDGIRDPGDTTVFAGITINLWTVDWMGDCNTRCRQLLTGSTVTDANGVYTFATYRMAFTRCRSTIPLLPSAC